jgi:putative hydrolase of the HAD superfamily
MFDSDKVKGIVLDYGGTIDTNGIHWAEVIRASYEALQIPASKEAFRQAYAAAERKLATQRIILPHHNFWHVLRLKAEAQLQWLAANGCLPAGDDCPTRYAASIADWCYASAQTSINAARPVLKKLSERYPLFLVTNFYGNIEAVLKDFYLREYFDSITESAVAGVRKPDPAIFRLAIERSGLAPGELAVVGDSYDKDVVPATAVGCQTIWLKKTGWNEYRGDETAGLVIDDFAKLKEVFHLH